MEATRGKRVALVHDWLTGMRGGEKVLEVLCRRFPDADLFTLIHRRGSLSADIERLRIHTSLLQWLPGVQSYYRFLLPLMPAAMAALRLPPVDLAISSSHCVAKAVRVPKGVPHVCYCHTPMRYAWQMRSSYFGGGSSVKARLRDAVLDRLRDWDRNTAHRVTHFIANSRTVQHRIADCYERESIVIYPPVDTDYYCPAPVPREDFYLVVSALAPYKRHDLAIEACNRLKKQLIVIGSGQDAARLKTLAGPTIRFLGWQSDEAIRDHMRKCRALLFPGEEDFGIVPVEAQGCGAPVIAFGKGGATETVLPASGKASPTGLWFEEQNADSLTAAIERFETLDCFDSSDIRRHAERFNRHRFERELFDYLDRIGTTVEDRVRLVA